LNGSENWSLTLRLESRLRLFENTLLRRVFGPKRDEVTEEWIELHEEHHKVMTLRLSSNRRQIHRGRKKERQVRRDFSMSLLNCCPLSLERNEMRAVRVSCDRVCSGMLLVELGSLSRSAFMTLSSNSAGLYWTRWGWHLWCAKTCRIETKC
jgi:hypothetical protein